MNRLKDTNFSIEQQISIHTKFTQAFLAGAVDVVGAKEFPLLAEFTFYVGRYTTNKLKYRRIKTSKYNRKFGVVSSDGTRNP